MRYIMGGADIEQVDFNLIQAYSLLSTNSFTQSENLTNPFTFSKENLKGQLIIQASSMVATHIDLQILENQNGAFTPMPGGIFEIPRFGLYKFNFKITKFKEIKVKFNVLRLTEFLDPFVTLNILLLY